MREPHGAALTGIHSTLTEDCANKSVMVDNLKTHISMALPTKCRHLHVHT